MFPKLVSQVLINNSKAGVIPQLGAAQPAEIDNGRGNIQTEGRHEVAQLFNFDIDIIHKFIY